MAAWAIEQHPIEAVVAAGLREADDLAEQRGLGPATLRPLRQAADGDWGPYTPGMPLDAVATLATILHVLREPTSLANAMKRAVALGGDTDTTAAIVGGILGCRLEDIDHAIPWLSKVLLPRAEIVEATAAGLGELRGSRHG
jgi:ADP-ribosyl-[dinitrogen reductase] hydrolase